MTDKKDLIVSPSGGVMTELSRAKTLMRLTNEILDSRKPDPELLFSAVKKGDIAEVKRLIAAGADVNAAKGWTALHWAASKGHAEVAKVLLAGGANPNAADKHGDTALMAAALWGNAEVAKVLLSAGADANAADNKSETALHEAARHGYDEIVKMLLAAGANVNTASNCNETTLMLAKVLWLGADANAAENGGETALMIAAFWGNVEMVKMLLAARANPHQADNDGWTALDFANERWSWAKAQEKEKELMWELKQKAIVEMLRAATKE